LPSASAGLKKWRNGMRKYRWNRVISPPPAAK
jgi:hypothetical protein